MRSESDQMKASLAALARAERAERAGQAQKARTLRLAAARRLPRARLRTADLCMFEQPPG